MSTVTARRRGIVARLAALALTLGAIGVVDAAVAAPDAAAAACYGSNITSTRAYNVNCTAGAYGYKKSANATVGYQLGAWVTAGHWSYNPTLSCYQYPTLVRG
jgi:hypothetical protein